MTIPHERTRSLVYALEFLSDLLDPKKTPRIPREIRRRAGSILRHYPYEYEIRLLHRRLPKLFGKWPE